MNTHLDQLRKEALRKVRSLVFSYLVVKLVEEFRAENKDSRHKFISENGRFIYHVAIIDYL